MSAPDDRRPDDDAFDDADRELAARVATVLVARAGALVVADEVFDPTRAATLDLPDDPGRRRPGDAPVRGAAGPVEGRGAAIAPDVLEPLPVTPIERRRRGRSPWIAGLAAAAVLIAAIVMVNAVRQPTVDTGNPDRLVAPDSAWEPSWVPDGLELWRLDATAGDAETVLASETGRPADVPVVQLFESAADDTRVLVAISTLDERPASDGTPTSVRGVDGTTRSERREAPGKPVETRFEWNEAGHTFNALVAESATAEAAALLDGLTFSAPDDPSKGFAEPTGGAWTVRTDDPRTLPETSVVVARFGYDDTRPEDGRSSLEVLTVPGGPAGSGFVGYLSTGYLGSIRADGVAFSFEAGDGDRPSQSFTVWPDGRTVYVQGVGLDEATAAQIADGVVPISREGLRARIDEVSARLGAGAVLAAADLPSGRIEVIGSPAPSAICLTAGGRRSCKGPDLSSGNGVPLLGSFLVDGSWLLVAAVDGGLVSFTPGSGSTTSFSTTAEVIDPESDGTGPTTTRPGPGAGVGNAGTTPGTAMPGSSGPFESTIAGSWSLALFAAPGDATSVTIDTTGRSATFLRPTF